MASNKKIAEIIALLKTIYPFYAKDVDSIVLAKAWKMLLIEYPDEAVEISFLKCCKKCKQYPPTPADVVEQLENIRKATEPSDEEMWGLFLTTLKATENLTYRFRYTAIDSNGLTQGDNARNQFEQLWDNLNESLKQYIGSKGELMRMARDLTYDDEALRFEKQRFVKMMPVMKARVEYIQIGNSLSERLTEGESKLFLNKGGEN